MRLSFSDASLLNEVDRLDRTIGSFSTYGVSIRTKYSKVLTDSPLDVSSSDSLQAWVTMIHEWVHFAQMCSTTWGLNHTLRVMSQLTAFNNFCAALRAKGESLKVPVLKAVQERRYSRSVQADIRQFLSSWQGAAARCAADLGFATNWRGRLHGSTLAALSPYLARRLETRALAFEELSLKDILEYIAMGCQGQFLNNRLGIEEAVAVQRSVMRGDKTYHLMGMIERELGINHATRMILHDLALMTPFEFPRRARAASSKEATAPVQRLVRALEVIARGEVSQARDAESGSYLGLAGDLASRLRWPPLGEVLEEAVEFASDLCAGVPVGGKEWPFWVLHFGDFLRAFRVRLATPDAFVCLTTESTRLYETGWQPVWIQPEGYLQPSGRPPEEGQARALLSLTRAAARALVTGTRWDCPRDGECGGRLPLNAYCPCGGQTATNCHCRESLEVLMGDAFEPEAVCTV